MRIGCLQFAPQVGDVNNNLNRADAVLNRADPDGLDLLVLPEMAFSGYNFKSLSEIAPFLEHSGSGISSLWARTVALKYDCTVIVGYPEKVDPTVKWPTGPEYYNAAIVVNGDGETVANYRKTHLYMTDEKWALENPAGFYNGFLIGLGRTAIGICMDLNPYKFEAPWHAFEFAFHVLEMDANLVVLTMAWMTREDGRMFSRMPQEPDMDTLAYWVTRLEPIIRSDNEDEIIVVFANRTGIEDEAVYAGTSAVLGIKDGEVRVYGILGRGDKELLVVDTENSPYAQLIHRPDGHVVPADGASSLHRSPVDPKKKPFDEHENNENAPEGGTAPGSGSGSLSGHASSSGSSKRSAKAVNGTHSARRKGRNGLSLQTDTARMQNHKETSPTVKTPTCPSPTPISLRPRLTIPPAPSLTMKYLDSQVPSPYPMALHPAPSETQTVLYTENQLTPYPGSHPHSQQGNMPGGHSYGMANGVAANSPQKSMSHFSDSSPASPQLYWMPPSKLLHSPTKSRGWTPTGSDGTAFSETGSTSNRGHPHPSATNLTHYRVDSQPARAKPKQRHPSVDLASKPAGAPGTPADGQQASADSEQLPDRPASPKSRNASRSRGPERPGSAVDASTNLEEISVKLGEIAKRVSSVQGRGTPKQVNGGPVLPDGVTDRQLLEEMRDQRDDNASRQSIPIAACLSIWEDAQIGSAPPNGNGHDRLTNGLPTSTAGQPSQPSGSSLVRGRDVERPPSRANNWQPSSGPTAARTVSRGRQPQASHSTPPRANGQNGHTSGTGSRPSGSREPIDLSQFQLIEEYRSPDCPLHGVRSQSATQSNESPQPPRRRTSNGPPRRIISQSPPHRPTPPDRAQTSAPAMASVDSVLRPATGPAHPSQSYVPDFSMSVESVNSSNPSPKTPFEPQTPKAMKLVFDDQSAPIMEMGLKCVEAVTEIGISRPKSAVW